MNASLKEKLNRLFAQIKGIDVVLIVNTNNKDPNFTYFTDFKGGLFERSFLIIKRNEIVLLTNALEYGIAMEQKPEGMKVIQLTSSEQAKKLMSSYLKSKNVGINGAFITFGAYNLIRDNYGIKKMIDISEAFVRLRLIKGKDEIEKIRKAVKITKRAMILIKRRFKIGMTEKELASEFDEISAQLGSDDPSFETIVCFGKNAALPHHSPDETKLKYGDFVLIDAGCRLNNYCSDLTRTFIFGNKNRISDYDKKIRIYNTVKQAQLLGIEAMKNGVMRDVPYYIALKHIEGADDGKYKGTFIHSFGHSIGIEVHDSSYGIGPIPNKATNFPLKKGMVFSAEPGIYIEGFGGVRIEDDILITDKGAEVL